MVERNFTKESVFSVEQLYNMVVDVASYPKFLPWCAASRIISDNENEMIADLVVSFSGFRETYRSKVSKLHNKEIKVDLLEGPFEYLKNYWQFEALENGHTKIEFYIKFKFSNSIFDKLAGVFFEKAMAKMIDAFEERAKTLYNK